MSRRSQTRKRHVRFWSLVSILCTMIGMLLLFGGAIAHDAGDHTLQVVCWMSSLMMVCLAGTAIFVATD